MPSAMATRGPQAVHVPPTGPPGIPTSSAVKRPPQKFTGLCVYPRSVQHQGHGPLYKGTHYPPGKEAWTALQHLSTTGTHLARTALPTWEVNMDHTKALPVPVPTWHSAAHLGGQHGPHVRILGLHYGRYPPGKSASSRSSSTISTAEDHDVQTSLRLEVDALSRPWSSMAMTSAGRDAHGGGGSSVLSSREGWGARRWGHCLCFRCFARSPLAVTKKSVATILAVNFAEAPRNRPHMILQGRALSCSVGNPSRCALDLPSSGFARCGTSVPELPRCHGKGLCHAILPEK